MTKTDPMTTLRVTLRLLWVCAAATLALACTPGEGSGSSGEDIVAQGDFSTAFPPTSDVVVDSADSGPADSGPGNDLDADAPGDGGGSADGSDCTDGAPCSDGDPCTFNDKCEGGVCAGIVVECDDALPCTTDACVGGTCEHAVASGFCKIDDGCWSDAQPNPTNGCQRCLSGVHTRQWSDNDGVLCDDGDTCTGPDLCQAGACTGATLVCPDDADPCTIGECQGGGCVSAPLSGSACDDGDACTEGDSCDKGVCVPGPAGPQCDDNLSCTADGCAPGGGCTHTLLPNFCAIDGACVPDGVVDGANPCRSCRAGMASDAWSPNDGAACGVGCGTGVCSGGVCVGAECPDDGNPCTQAACVDGGCTQVAFAKDTDMDMAVDKACGGTDCNDGLAAINPAAAEDCSDGVDNDCDSMTDGADVECGGATACAYHTDCWPERVCGLQQVTGQTVCSDPCDHVSDCRTGEMCSKVPGSAQVGYCEPHPPAGLVDGQPCSMSAQCASGLCANSFCRSFCLDEGGCTAVGQTCQLAGDLQAGILGSFCGPDPAGTIPLGQQCCQGQSCGGAACASGHCDLMPINSQQWTCDRLCTSEADCSPAQECNIILYSPVSNPEAVPYDPQFTQPTHDALMGCYTPPAFGALGDGQPCNLPSDCRSYKCLPLLPGDPQAYCTSTCIDDAECVPGMQCKLEALTLASSWLQEPAVGGQGAQPGSWTLVRLCKFQ